MTGQSLVVKTSQVESLILFQTDARCSLPTASLGLVDHYITASCLGALCPLVLADALRQGINNGKNAKTDLIQ